MRACKSFARWSGDFEDRVNVLSDDIRALICQDAGCQTCRDICEERKQCLSFHVRWFSPFDLPDLIAVKPRSSFSGETSSTLASMNTTIHSSHITRWRFQACDRKVRPFRRYYDESSKAINKNPAFNLYLFQCNKGDCVEISDMKCNRTCDETHFHVNRINYILLQVVFWYLPIIKMALGSF